MEPDFVFQRMMEYIVKNDFNNAKISAMNDMNKISDNCLSSMLIMSANTDIELIKTMAGFAIMSDKVKQYYTNPEKAIVDYS
jgi:mevalonate pyrophosphate decarboxylase